MNKNTWNITKIVMGVILIISTFYFGYSYLNKVYKTPNANYGESFHNMDEDSVDVLVLGSSHAQYSFCPTFFYEDTGLYSYVLGSACQPLNVSYEMLKEALKSQSPSLLVLEVYTATPLKEWCMGDSCYVMAEYQMTGEEKQNVIGFLPSDKAKEYRNEFINNHNNWRSVESFKDLYEKKSSSFIDPCFGYVKSDASLPVDNWWYAPVYEGNEEVELEEEDVEALNNILSLCKEENIELLLYMMPMDGIDVLNQSYRYKVWDYAKENNINYIDFVDIGEELDYRMCVHNDGAHSYVNGASYITDYLANYIKDNYVIENHQSSEKLDKLYKSYSTIYTFDVLRTEYNPLKYLNRIINYKDTFLVSYRGSEISEEVKNYLILMGLDINEDDNCYAIIKDEEVICKDNFEINTTIDKHEVVINDSGIYFDGSLLSDGDLLSFVVFDEDYDDKVIKTIDYISGIPWDYGYDFNYNKVN